jgi:hypothetical protein
MDGAGVAQSEEAELIFLANTSGLQQAMRGFPEDFAAAVRTVAQLRGILPELGDGTLEPWPPMRMRGVS